MGRKKKSTIWAKRVYVAQDKMIKEGFKIDEELDETDIPYLLDFAKNILENKGLQIPMPKVVLDGRMFYHRGYFKPGKNKEGCFIKIGTKRRGIKRNETFPEYVFWHELAHYLQWYFSTDCEQYKCDRGGHCPHFVEICSWLYSENFPYPLEEFEKAFARQGCRVFYETLRDDLGHSWLIN